MIRMGVSGWMFLLVPAYPGSPGQKAVKRLCVCMCRIGIWLDSASPLFGTTLVPSSKLLDYLLSLSMVQYADISNFTLLVE